MTNENAVTKAQTGQDLEKISKTKTELKLRKMGKALFARSAITSPQQQQIFQSLLITYARDKAIAACNPDTFLQAALTMAELGLMPAKQLGHAYLVPYKGKVVFVMGYKGMIHLARSSGMVSTVQARLVHEGDYFEQDFGGKTTFVPWYLRDKATRPEQRGEPVGVVVWAQLEIGSRSVPQVDFYTVDELDWYGKKYGGAKSFMWSDFKNEARIKTAVRRAATFWPQSIDFAQGLSKDHTGDPDYDYQGEAEVVDDEADTGEDDAGETAGGEAAAEPPQGGGNYREERKARTEQTAPEPVAEVATDEQLGEDPVLSPEQVLAQIPEDRPVSWDTVVKAFPGMENVVGQVLGDLVASGDVVEEIDKVTGEVMYRALGDEDGPSLDLKEKGDEARPPTQGHTQEASSSKTKSLSQAAIVEFIEGTGRIHYDHLHAKMKRAGYNVKNLKRAVTKAINDGVLKVNSSQIDGMINETLVTKAQWEAAQSDEQLKQEAPTGDPNAQDSSTIDTDPAKVAEFRDMILKRTGAGSSWGKLALAKSCGTVSNDMNFLQALDELLMEDKIVKNENGSFSEPF